MAAGQLDRRIIIERQTKGAADAFNETPLTWSTFTTVWAGRQDVSDGERVAADQVGSTVMSRFKVRSTIKTRGVTAVDRINYDGKIWNIHGIKETKDGRKRFLEITAITSTDV